MTHSRALRFSRALALSAGLSACAGSPATPQTAADTRGTDGPASEGDCRRRNPTRQACTTAGTQCAGQASHCVGEGSDLRCSGEEWRCTCAANEGDGGLAWNCQEVMHPAGPRPPPDLPSRSESRAAG